MAGMTEERKFWAEGLSEELRAEAKRRNGGRPEIYTPEIAGEILYRLAHGEVLSQICTDEHLPSRMTVYTWLHANKDGFHDKYTRAKQIGMLAIEDSTFEIVDDGRNDWVEKEGLRGNYIALNNEAIQRSKLRMEHRQWYLSVSAPKKFGAKQSLELTGKDGGPVHMKSEEKADKIAQLLAAAELRKSNTKSEEPSDDLGIDDLI